MTKAMIANPTTTPPMPTSLEPPPSLAGPGGLRQVVRVRGCASGDLSRGCQRARRVERRADRVRRLHEDVVGLRCTDRAAGDEGVGGDPAQTRHDLTLQFHDRHLERHVEVLAGEPAEEHCYRNASTLGD